MLATAGRGQRIRTSAECAGLADAAATANMDKEFDRFKALSGSPFSGFKREEGSEIYAPQHDANSKLTSILGAWERFEVDFDRKWHSAMIIPQLYVLALNAVSGIHCPSNDLRAFLVLFPDPELPQEDHFHFLTKVPLFVSALINDGSGDSYILDAAFLSSARQNGWTRGWDYLCYANRKYVVINGDVEGVLGGHTESGTVVVKGSARNFVGHYMTGGKIIIERDAGWDVGYEMSGGEVHIHGNCGVVGKYMSGGEIHIGGKCKGVDERITGGRVFVGGVQVYPPLGVV